MHEVHRIRHIARLFLLRAAEPFYPDAQKSTYAADRILMPFCSCSSRERSRRRLNHSTANNSATGDRHVLLVHTNTMFISCSLLAMLRTVESAFARLLRALVSLFCVGGVVDPSRANKRGLERDQPMTNEMGLSKMKPLQSDGGHFKRSDIKVERLGVTLPAMHCTTSCCQCLMASFPTHFACRSHPNALATCNRDAVIACMVLSVHGTCFLGDVARASGVRSLTFVAVQLVAQFVCIVDLSTAHLDQRTTNRLEWMRVRLRSYKKTLSLSLSRNHEPFLSPYSLTCPVHQRRQQHGRTRELL